MKIVELSEDRYLDYLKKNNSISNIDLITNKNKKRRLGLIDDDTIKSIIIIEEKKTFNKYRIGTTLDLQIDYEDEELFITFINLLKKYLQRRNYIYLTIPITYPYKIYDKKQNILSFNTNILKLLDRLSLIKTNKENNKIALLHTTNSVQNLYRSLNSNTKRNIKLSLQRSITIEESNTSPFNNYEEIKSNLLKNNLVPEVYIAKLNTSTYLNNYYYLLSSERERNELLNNKILNPNIKTTKRLINKKIISDKLITKYNREINRATLLNSKYSNDIILSSIIIGKSTNTIYFLDKDYHKELNYLSTSHLLIWEIIKKYLTKNYHNFYFGKIKDNNSLFYTGFTSTINTPVGIYDLVVDKILYPIEKTHQKIVRK